MSTTFLRLGLWIVILSLTLYVLDTTFPNSPFSELIELPLVIHLMMLSIVLIAASVVMRVVGKTAAKTNIGKNRCRVCNTVIPAGAIYCRPHLRGVLEREDRKTHSSRIR